MPVITPSTFEELAAYVNVRFQQGVPIADADLNEMDDIRKFELRAFLKWFVGDGIPNGNNGFGIGAAAAVAGNFTVNAGVAPLPAPPDALRNAGCAVVDGRIVYITANVDYVNQPLHASQPTAAALAARMGTRVEPVLTAPGAAGTLTVFLDIFERVVRSDEPGAGRLLLPGLGVETCARLRREWVVRTRTAAGVPVSGDPDFEAGHSYYVLAQVTRRASDNNINPADIQDRRRTGLTLSSMQDRIANLETRLLLPAFGVPPFTPNAGVAGTLITINGRNFTVGTPTVHFVQGATATPAPLAAPPPTATQIRVDAPALPAGSYTIRVTTEGGVVTSAGPFVII
jgi:hypothetical protein